MGQIVGAFATSHVLGAPDGVEEQSERVFQGMRQIGQRLRAARPDVLVVITSDHLNNFHVDSAIPFSVGIDASFTPYGDMGLPTDPFPGLTDFAQGFADFAAAGGLPIAPIDGVRPDHGVMIPQAVVDPDRRIPTVPFYVNSVLHPCPEPAQCWRAGGLLKRFIEEVRPAGERVALLAGGGLSHWLAMPGEGRVNAAWDRAFMQTLVEGRGEALAAFTAEGIEAEAGNGGLEVSAWITLAGAVPGAMGEVIYYEPIPAWANGMGGVAMHV
jgi:protocatechuate 4,5-dioxygenase beta chain/2'-aminobiphenyl-2,3-diol 1,2-dioxygenase large subunit